jgi:hypothetical protein
MQTLIENDPWAAKSQPITLLQVSVTEISTEFLNYFSLEQSTRNHMHAGIHIELFPFWN